MRLGLGLSITGNRGVSGGDSRINLLSDPQNMEGAAWYNTGGMTVSGNTLTGDGSDGVHRHRQLVAGLATDTQYFFDLDVENVDATAIGILMTKNNLAAYYQRIFVQTSDWTISQSASGTNSSDPSVLRTVINLGGGVYRLRLSGVVTGSPYNEVAILLSNSTTPDGNNPTSDTGFNTDVATGSIIVHDAVFYEAV